MKYIFLSLRAQRGNPGNCTLNPRLPRCARNDSALLALVMTVLLLFCAYACAQTLDRYPLPTAAQQQQFQGLISQLRCLVCQNQDLADSNADLAKDLRRQVYEMVLAKQTDAQIKQYMTDRYGDFILFKPPFNLQTIVLWGMPLLLLAVGLIILWRLTCSRKNNVC